MQILFTGDVTPESCEAKTPRYRATDVAGGYSAATGVGAGFALAAIVLVFTIAEPSRTDRYYLAFAASAFTVATIGFVFCSFSYANLSGADESEAAFLHLMLNSAVLTICFMTELSGFDALARAYLPSTSDLFIYIICASLVMSPLWIWSVEVDVIHGFPRRNKHHFQRERGVAVFLAALLVAGGAVVAVAVVARHGATPSSTHSHRYISLALTLLGFVGALTIAGATASCRTNGVIRLPRLVLAGVATAYLGLAGYLISALP